MNIRSQLDKHTQKKSTKNQLQNAKPKMLTADIPAEFKAQLDEAESVKNEKKTERNWFKFALVASFAVAAGIVVKSMHSQTQSKTTEANLGAKTLR